MLWLYILEHPARAQRFLSIGFSTTAAALPALTGAGASLVIRLEPQINSKREERFVTTPNKVPLIQIVRKLVGARSAIFYVGTRDRIAREEAVPRLLKLDYTVVVNECAVILVQLAHYGFRVETPLRGAGPAEVGRSRFVQGGRQAMFNVV